MAAGAADLPARSGDTKGGAKGGVRRGLGAGGGRGERFPRFLALGKQRTALSPGRRAVRRTSHRTNQNKIK